MFGGNMRKSLPAIYNFNNNLEKHYWTNKQRSESCGKFKELVDRDLGGWAMSTVSWEPAVMKEQLFRHGPFVIGFD